MHVCEINRAVRRRLEVIVARPCWPCLYGLEARATRDDLGWKLMPRIKTRLLRARCRYFCLIENSIVASPVFWLSASVIFSRSV